MNIERIIITFNPDGTFRGASTQDSGGLPAPVSQAALGGVGEDIGQTLLAAMESKDAEIAGKDAQIAELADFKTRAESGIAQVVAVIQDPAIDHETTIQTVLAVIAEGTAPEEEKIRAEKLAQLEALKSELGIA